MPLYEYKCPHCGAEMEIMLSIEEAMTCTVECTECFVDGEVQEDMERQMGTIATFSVKGKR